MRVLHHLRHPIDALRTAPLGFAVLAIEAGAGGAVAVFGAETGIVSPWLGAMVMPGVMAGVSVAARQFKLRERMENVFAEEGFSERHVAKTVGEWCARQTTIVAAEQFGLGDKCRAYYDAQPLEAKSLPRLPHF